MINAIQLNCQILALDTKFNIEMLQNRETIFFKKNVISVSESINLLEKKYLYFFDNNKNYKFPNAYQWNHIVIQYLNLFNRLIKNS